MTYVGLYFGMVLSRFIAVTTSSRSFLFGLWIWFLVLFVGTREWTGCDFAGYLNRFNFYSTFPLSDSIAARDPGFILLNYAVIGLNLDYMWLNIFAAVIFFGCFYLFARQKPEKLHLLALIFPILVVQLAMSGLRQGLATAILLLAWNAFTSRNRTMFIVWVLVAAQFHSSALMFLPLVLMIGQKITLPRLALAGILMMPAIAFLARESISVYQTRYVEGGVGDSQGAIFRIILALIPAIIFEAYRTRFRDFYPKDFALMRIFALAAFALVPLFLMSTTAAHRVNYYLMPIHMLILARVPSVMSPRRPNFMYEVLPFMVYGLYMIVWFSLSRHARLCYTPYETFLL